MTGYVGGIWGKMNGVSEIPLCGKLKFFWLCYYLLYWFGTGGCSQKAKACLMFLPIAYVKIFECIL